MHVNSLQTLDRVGTPKSLKFVQYHRNTLQCKTKTWGKRENLKLINWPTLE